MTSTEGKKGIRSNALRAVLFLVVIAGVVFAFSKIFGFTDQERTETVLREFYAEKENTIDCIYLGSSASQRAFVEPVAFHDHGVAAYTLGSGGQPFVLTKSLIEESQKTQKPRLYIVELRSAVRDADNIGDVAVRRVVDNMDTSATWLHAIGDVRDFADAGDNGIDKSGLTYYFPLLKYHSQWNPDKRVKYQDDFHYFKGYTLNAEAAFRQREIETKAYTEEAQPVSQESEKALNDLLDYCDSIDSDVLFVVSPYGATEDGIRKINYCQSIVEGRGYKCLNFLPEETRAGLGLDNRTCYYNREHLNYYGSLKYTDYICQYIKQNYGIEDRRGSEAYAAWEEAYDDLQKAVYETYSDRSLPMFERAKAVESAG